MSSNEASSGSLVWSAAILTLACLCICSGLCLAPIGWNVYRAVSEREDIESLIDDCVRAIEAHDSDAALAIFSPKAIGDGRVSREQLEALAKNPAFQDFDSLTATNFNVNRTFHTNPKAAQGTVMKMTGTVTYTNGDSGDFDATVVKEDGQWRLDALNLNRRFANGAAEPESQSPPRDSSPSIP